MRHKYFLSLCIGLLILSCKKDDNELPLPEPQATLEIINRDNVLLNPSGYAPLSAIIEIETSEAVRVSLKVLGKRGADSDILKEFSDYSSDLEIPVHGLYINAPNTVELTFYDKTGTDRGTKTYEITTGFGIADLPFITVEEANRADMAEGLTFVSYFGHAASEFPQRPFMFDSFGDIRWFLDFSGHPQLNRLFYDDGMERLKNGNLYFGSGGQMFGASGNNLVYEIDLFGNVIDTWPMTGYSFHHEVHEKPNGNFLVTVSKDGAATIEDYIIEIDRSTKDIVNVWDLNVSLDNTRTALKDDASDWIHTNAITYDETDDTIIISGRTQGLVKLTAANEVVWIMGTHKGWNLSGNGVDLNQFLLTPLNKDGDPIVDPAVLDGDTNHPDFEWNWYQHAPLITPEGFIMLFDNGDNRNYTNTTTYSRAVTYEVNETDKTIRQLWQYGKERGIETYSSIVSDVDYLEIEDHVLFSPGAVSINGGFYGKSIEVNVTDLSVVFEATIIPPNPFFRIITFHRTERLSLYPPE